MYPVTTWIKREQEPEFDNHAIAYGGIKEHMTEKNFDGDVLVKYNFKDAGRGWKFRLWVTEQHKNE